MLSSPEWLRFAFVRNPYARLFSAYKSKIGNTWEQEYDWLRDQIREAFDYPVRDGSRVGMVAFDDYVRFVAGSIASGKICDVERTTTRTIDSGSPQGRGGCPTVIGAGMIAVVASVWSTAATARITMAEPAVTPWRRLEA